MEPDVQPFGQVLQVLIPELDPKNVPGNLQVFLHDLVLGGDSQRAVEIEEGDGPVEISYYGGHLVGTLVGLAFQIADIANRRYGVPKIYHGDDLFEMGKASPPDGDSAEIYRPLAGEREQQFYGILERSMREFGFSGYMDRDSGQFRISGDQKSALDVSRIRDDIFRTAYENRGPQGLNDLTKQIMGFNEVDGDSNPENEISNLALSAAINVSSAIAKQLRQVPSAQPTDDGHILLEYRARAHFGGRDATFRVECMEDGMVWVSGANPIDRVGVSFDTYCENPRRYVQWQAPGFGQ